MKTQMSTDPFDYCSNTAKEVNDFLLHGSDAFDFVVNHTTGAQLIEYMEGMAGMMETIILEKCPELKDINPIARYIHFTDRLSMVIQRPFSIKNPANPNIFIAPFMFTIGNKTPSGEIVDDPVPCQLFIILELDTVQRVITSIIFPTLEQQIENGIEFVQETKHIPQSTRIN